jgi:hypothetical protein
MSIYKYGVTPSSQKAERALESLDRKDPPPKVKTIPHGVSSCPVVGPDSSI